MESKNRYENKKKYINDLYKERIRRAKNQEWDWFEVNEPIWSLSKEFERLYLRYHRIN